MKQESNHFEKRSIALIKELMEEGSGGVYLF